MADDAAAKHRKYRERVKQGLDRAYERADTAAWQFDVDADRLVVFSDHHRGTRDGADDFWRCERSYRGALGSYLESGHRLVLLGDVEELWENRPGDAIRAYGDTLELEREFHRAGRLVRFWGNHDDAWRHGGEVEKHLAPGLPGVKVHEALRVEVVSGGDRLGELFFVHGHQGTADSDRFSVFSRVFVRYGWRPIQRRFKMASTTPARDFALRANHDAAMYSWARARPERPVLVAGHTHMPVFGGTTPPVRSERSLEVVERELAGLRTGRSASSEAVAALRAEFEVMRTKPFGDPPQKLWPPCYYNSGCCSFGDGDVTGIELANGKIRLVRWLDNEYRPRPQLLAEDDLRAVLRAVAGAEAPAPTPAAAPL